MTKSKFLALMLSAYVLMSTTYSCLPFQRAKTTSQDTGTAAISREGKITKLEVIDLPNRIRIKLSGTQPITYTAFQVDNPTRFILDLNETSLGDYNSVIQISRAGVNRIVPTEAKGDIVVSRLEFFLDEDLENDIKIYGNNLLVDFFKPDDEFQPSYLSEEVILLIEEITTPETETPFEEALEEPSEEVAAEDQPEEITPSETTEETDTVTAEAEPETDAEVETDTSVEEAAPLALDEGELLLYTELEAASEIIGINIDKSGKKVFLHANGKMNPRVFTLGEKRIVIDIPGVISRLDKNTFAVNKTYLDRIRIGQHPDSVRIVLDVPKMSNYEVFAGRNDLVIALNVPDPAEKEDETGFLLADATPASAEEAETTEPGKTEEKAEATTAKEPAPLQVKPVPAQAKAAPVKAEPVSPQAEELQASLPRASVEITTTDSAETVFTGKQISLNLQDTDIRNLLRLIANVNNQNIVISDAVTGNITLKLIDVPGDQVLNVILEMNHLGMKIRRGIMTIDTLENINREQDEKARVLATKLRSEELITKVVYINYANATTIMETLSKNLSTRGNISADTRTNSLIILDVKKNIRTITKLIKHLDTKTRQVLIEARIVQVVPEFNKSLGIQWGASFTDIASNNITSFSTGNTSTFGVSTPDFGINMPAAGVVTPVPSIGFTFGRFTQNPFNLDLRLSAGEFEGLTKIISTPKITVLDNERAKIEQGESIPFSTTSQDGTQTTFIDANLSLDVVPHITSDNHVILQLKISKNAPGTTRAGAAGPSIEKREAQTTIILASGETAVIGGIFESNKVKSSSRVPILSSIPIIGLLFQNTELREKTTELIIFITPTILK